MLTCCMLTVFGHYTNESFDRLFHVHSSGHCGDIPVWTKLVQAASSPLKLAWLKKTMLSIIRTNMKHLAPLVNPQNPCGVESIRGNDGQCLSIPPRYI